MKIKALNEQWQDHWPEIERLKAETRASIAEPRAMFVEMGVKV